MNKKPNHPSPSVDDAIEALLAGDLSSVEVDKLHQAAVTDQQLATAIINAWTIREGLDELQPEIVSAQLEQRLMAIPTQSKPFWQRWLDTSSWQEGPGWAVASVMAIAIIIAMGVQQQPSRAEILQAREELEIALIYVGKTLNQADQITQAELGFQLRQILEEKSKKPKSTINL